MARPVTKSEIAMLGMITICVVIGTMIGGPSVGIAALFGSLFWGVLIYGLVWLCYWFSGNREKAPHRFRFIVIATLVGSVAVALSEFIIFNTSDDSSATNTQAEIVDGQAQQQELERERLANLRKEEQQKDLYRAALTDTVGQLHRAMKQATAREQFEMLHQVDASGCPPDFAQAFVDLKYAVREVRDASDQREAIRSDGSINKMVLTQVLQVLTESKESSVMTAMSDDEKLAKAEQIWIEKANIANHDLARSAAGFGINY